MDAKSIFLNEHNRLRSGWRFTIYLLSYFVLASVLSVIMFSVLSLMQIGSSQSSLLAFTAPFIALSAIAIFLGWLYGRVFEDLPFRALGCWFTENWFKDLVWGMIIGAFSIGLAALIAFVFGGLRFEFNREAAAAAILSTLAVTLLIFIAGAVSEETLFRGYLLQTLSRAKLAWLGAILTAALFATGHNNNPSANLLSWTNTLIAGIWLAIAYSKTRNLWFPLGIHLAWNWVQGAFLGISVSGLNELAQAPILRASDSGPEWLTGGSYGVEGGFACTVALIFSTILIYFLPVLRPTEEMLALTNEEKDAYR